jgi:neutral ceramidase
VLPYAISDIYPLDDAVRAAIDTYGIVLEGRVSEAVRQAFGTMEAVTLSSGSGFTHFAVNRRENVEAQILENPCVEGPSDHFVPVIRAARPYGWLLAVVLGYACHGTVLDGYQWSGDYPGCAQSQLEAAHPGAKALFFAGCGADQNPMPRCSVERARQYGRELAAAVDRVLEEEVLPLEPRLQTHYREIELALAEMPGPEGLPNWSKTPAAMSSAATPACWRMRAPVTSFRRPNSIPYKSGAPGNRR